MLEPAAPTADPPSRPDGRPSRLATPAVWLVSLGALAVGGLIASLFVMMPVSLDLGEMVAAGADPWRDAASAAIGFALLFAASVVALLLWHRSRGGRGARLAVVAITAAEAGIVAWAAAAVMHDWF